MAVGYDPDTGEIIYDNDLPTAEPPNKPKPDSGGIFAMFELLIEYWTFLYSIAYDFMYKLVGLDNYRFRSIDYFLNPDKNKNAFNNFVSAVIIYYAGIAGLGGLVRLYNLYGVVKG